MRFEISQKNLNDFLLSNEGSFLQSFEWGEFQKSLGKEVLRVVMEKEKPLFFAQIIKEKIPFLGDIFYIPYGPVFEKSLFLEKKEKIFSFFLKEIKKIALKDKVIFLKIEPQKKLPKVSFESTFSIKRYQPQKTLILDLKMGEEKIFKNFHPKHRYNIRLSQKKGVKVKIFKKNDPFLKKAISEFYFLLKKTSKRNKFKPYPETYFQKFFNFLEAELFLAEYQKKVIAGHLILYFQKKAYYLHGAFDYDFRKLMAPHLLHWEGIRRAIKKGCEIYDFWGIDEKKWRGLTRFKKGFGGKEILYPQAMDFIFDKKRFFIYLSLKKILTFFKK